MLKQRFFRGFLLVLLAQIPLICFFVYLLFLGVGIADFSKLAALRSEPAASDGTDAQARQQTRQNGERIEQLAAQIRHLEDTLSSPALTVQTWERFVQETGAEPLGRIAADIQTLETRLAPLAREVSLLSGSVAQLEQSLNTQIAGITQQIENLKADLAAGEAVRDAATSQLRDEMQNINSTPYVAPPKREPVAELRFEAEDWEIGKEGQAALNKLVRTIKNSGSKAGVRIYGFTVKQGSLNYNLALADKRARAVADVLRAKGIKRNPITIYVVPEYNAYRDPRDKRAGAKIQAVHIYIDDPVEKNPG
jgi:outer membrane protein OmpA-like peptidoglycan-associated protein/cell division protein FtsB